MDFFNQFSNIGKHNTCQVNRTNSATRWFPANVRHYKSETSSFRKFPDQNETRMSSLNRFLPQIIGYLVKSYENLQKSPTCRANYLNEFLELGGNKIYQECLRDEISSNPAYFFCEKLFSKKFFGAKGEGFRFFQNGHFQIHVHHPTIATLMDFRTIAQRIQEPVSGLFSKL